MATNQSPEEIIDFRELQLLVSELGLEPTQVAEIGHTANLWPIRCGSFERKVIDKYFRQSNADPYLRVSIVNVWSVDRREDIIKYRAQRYHHKRSSLLWHGTRNSNVCPILEKGLKTRAKDSPIDFDFGPALYFADRVNKSIGFCYDCKQVKFLFLCQVATGTMCEKAEMKKYYRQPNGYDCIKGLGNWQPKPSETVSMYGMDVPLGHTVYNPVVVGNIIRYNEYCIYTARRAIIRYLVAFQDSHQSD